MADPEGYVYCNNDLEVHAGDRTSYKTAGWWSENAASGGMCLFGGFSETFCGTVDVRAWFAAADNYIRKPFTKHFNQYNAAIQSGQGAANNEQAQIISEAQGIIDAWSNYAKYYKRGGGGPVGSSFQLGGFSWDSPNDADPKGPDIWDVISSNEAIGLNTEIVDQYDAAACLRDKFNQTKPQGMLEQRPGYGSVTNRPPGESSGSGSGGMDTLAMVGIGVGLWIVIKALSE